MIVPDGGETLADRLGRVYVALDAAAEAAEKCDDDLSTALRGMQTVIEHWREDVEVES
jgi:hypothetical protein